MRSQKKANDLLIMHKRIILGECPVLYDRPFSVKSFEADWEVRHGEWRCVDGALVGRNPNPAPGVAILKQACPGNVLVDFFGQTILPSTHDIDVMWNMSWNRKKDKRGVAYVAGIQGWWDGKVGVEKSPDYKLIAATPCPWFRPGREYHIQAGSIDGHCFVFVDGVLRLELRDPDPIDSSKHNRVGFEAFQSMVRIQQLVIRRIAWEQRSQRYSTEFE